ncbi:MAG: toxin HicA [Azospirillum sp.]|nr:toxin HicA [Azospirillum sp.]
MAKIDDILERMRTNPNGISFADASSICEHYFGKPRQKGTSHAVYKMPWPGDPRVNIQEGKSGKAKGYQVRQIVQAIDRLNTLKAAGTEAVDDK